MKQFCNSNLSKCSSIYSKQICFSIQVIWCTRGNHIYWSLYHIFPCLSLDQFYCRFILLLFSSCYIQNSLSQFDINNIVNISQSVDQLSPNQTDDEITQENTLGKKADQDEVDLSAACDETNPSIKIC